MIYLESLISVKHLNIGLIIEEMVHKGTDIHMWKRGSVWECRWTVGDKQYHFCDENLPQAIKFCVIAALADGLDYGRNVELQPEMKSPPDCT